MYLIIYLKTKNHDKVNIDYYLPSEMLYHYFYMQYNGYEKEILISNLYCAFTSLVRGDASRIEVNNFIEQVDRLRHILLLNQNCTLWFDFQEKFPK